MSGPQLIGYRLKKENRYPGEEGILFQDHGTENLPEIPGCWPPYGLQTLDCNINVYLNSQNSPLIQIQRSMVLA